MVNITRYKIVLGQSVSGEKSTIGYLTNVLFSKYIVACQRGGLSNKPSCAPGSDKTWGQGSFGPFTGGLNLAIATYKIFKKKQTVHLTRQCELGTSQYIIKIFINYIFSCSDCKWGFSTRLVVEGSV